MNQHLYLIQLHPQTAKLFIGSAIGIKCTSSLFGCLSKLYDQIVKDELNNFMMLNIFKRTLQLCENMIYMNIVDGLQ